MTNTPTIRIRGDQLAKYRAVAELKTASALADRMGVDPTTVARTLSGDARLTTGFIEALLGAFPGLELGDLIAVEYDTPAAEAVPA